MSLEPGLIAYAALACLALASHKHRASSRRWKIAPLWAQITGVLLLLVSMATATAASGVAQGIVAWVGQLSVAAVALVLTMSWKPRIAVFFAAPALVLSIIVGRF